MVASRDFLVQTILINPFHTNLLTSLQHKALHGVFDKNRYYCAKPQKQSITAHYSYKLSKDLKYSTLDELITDSRRFFHCRIAEGKKGAVVGVDSGGRW